jgi:hypothetical protein
MAKKSKTIMPMSDIEMNPATEGKPDASAPIEKMQREKRLMQAGIKMKEKGHASHH